MKNKIFNLGKTLSKSEQKLIKGSALEQLPICKCDTVGRIINQPCDGYGTGCGVIDVLPVDICDVFPSLC